MSTNFQITIVAPGRAGAITMTPVDPRVIASMPNRPVRLGNSLVGKVVSCEEFKSAGSTLVKMQITDPNAHTLLSTGCLSAAVTDDKQGEVVLRDIATPSGVTFGLQRCEGAPMLQKSFSHAPEYSDAELDKSDDGKVREGFVNSRAFWLRGASLPATPLTVRKAWRPSNPFRSHNSR